MAHALTTGALYTTEDHPDPADLRVERKTGILTPVRAFRRHIVVRIVTCLLLMWAAADLLVPELCSSETAAQDHGGAPVSQDEDDCFCCCSHVERARVVDVAFAELIPAVRETVAAQSLLIGAPRTVYHPPLIS
jgi:hypothetical protein